MGKDKKIPAGLVGLAKAETTFRIRTVEIIGNFIKDPDVEPLLKFLVILGLLDILTFSFIFVIAILQMLDSMFHNRQFEGLSFAMILVGLFLTLVLISFPLLHKARYAENGMRVRGDFRKIAQSRSRKKQP